MLCQQCQKRIANVHYTQIINGKKVELYLCEQCMNEKGQLGIGLQLNFGDFLWGLHSLGGNISFQQLDRPEEVRCPVCNMSFSEFSKTGRLGCSNCYKVFRNELNPILRRIHGTIEHKGKVPGKGVRGTPEKIENAISTQASVKNEEAVKPEASCNELERLKNELSEAIKREEYEKAAVLRDKIKELEGTGNKCGGVQDGSK
jgi:protein arginine kinase activator